MIPVPMFRGVANSTAAPRMFPLTFLHPQKGSKMKHLSPGLCAALAMAIAAGLAGCGGQPPAKAPPKAGDKPPAGAAAHDHPTKGPHGGPLIELGDEKFHAELVHDDKAGTVTIYILDSAGKKAVPIEAAEITINLKHDGKGEQFQLAAQADAGDPEGKSSRFVSNDKELGEDLDHEGSDPQLVVEIEGNQYRAKIEHGDDEAGHKHEHKDKNPPAKAD